MFEVTRKKPSRFTPALAARLMAVIGLALAAATVLLFAGTLTVIAQSNAENADIKPEASQQTAETQAQTALDDLFAKPAIRFPMIDEGQLPANVLPYAPSGKDAPDNTNQGRIYLSARLVSNGPEITSGLVWRIYSEAFDASGRLELLATSTGGGALFDLDPGTYLLHAAYGHAGITERLTVGRRTQAQSVVLDAGGLKLNAVVAQKTPLVSDKLRFDIFEMDFDERGERRVVARDIRAGAIARLNAGTYHVISRYGNVNAVVRADIRVEAGKLTEATIYHNAARVTLKLVNESGGEALANTAWSVLTPGGDAVVDGIGAFPSYVLAAGTYTVIARYQDKIFTHEFEVDSGRDREVEVKTTVATN